MPSRPSIRSGFPCRARRGSVILFVLGVILLTAFLLTRLIDRAGGELLAETKASSRAALRDQAYAALEVTFAVLADVSAADGGLYAPQQGWSNPLDYAEYQPPAGYSVEVAFEDESGKLPLPTVNEAVLQHYLETSGASTAEAERLTDALLAWTKKDFLPSSSDADPRNYENSPLPYKPPQRPLRTFEELRAVSVARDLFFDKEGRWTELGNRFRADASLYDFNNVNVNAAHSGALGGLGVDTTVANSVVQEIKKNAEQKNAGGFYRSVADASALHGGALAQAGLGAEVQCLKVYVTARQGGRVFTLEAVIEPGAGAGQTTASDTPNPTDNSDPNAPAPLTVDPRALTRKSIDYPFRILELRESDGPAQ